MPRSLFHAVLACPLDAKAVFLRLRTQRGCAWLDSARSNPHGDARYSIVAANPVSRLRYRNGRLEQINYGVGGAPLPAAAAPPGPDQLTALEQWLDSFGRKGEGLPAGQKANSVPSTATPCALRAYAGNDTAPPTAINAAHTPLNVSATAAPHIPADASVTPASLNASALPALTDAQQAALAFFRGGAIGYFSYEFGRQWEKHTPLPAAVAGFPQMDWALYDCAAVCNHFSDTTHIVACSTTSSADAFDKAQAFLRLLQQPAANSAAHRNSGYPGSSAAPQPPGATGADSTTASHATADDAACASETRRAAYMSAVKKVRAYIAQGDIYQTNIAQHFSAPLHEHPADLYLRLRDLNPAPYAAYLDTGDFQILSSSPELFLQKRGQRVLTRPIKGTRPRGRTPEEDARLREELSMSEKERAELLMIVDLERNDLGRVCEPGSVRVEALYRIETYATVHHLLADVSGTVKAGTSLATLLRATFPGGSITGAPKVRAMEIIDELERQERGIFCGAIGLLGVDASADLNIAIRTLLCARGAQGASVHASVGAGLVWDSDPRLEYEETLHKAEALLKAIHSQPPHPV